MEGGIMIKVTTRVFLALSGLLLNLIAIMLLVQPIPFFESNGIVVEASPSLLSEIKAPGGLLLSIGLMILFSTFSSEWSVILRATRLTILVYASYGIVRIYSFLVDGIPTPGIVVAAIIELLIAAVGILLFLSLKKLSKTKMEA